MLAQEIIPPIRVADRDAQFGRAGRRAATPRAAEVVPLVVLVPVFEPVLGGEEVDAPDGVALHGA